MKTVKGFKVYAGEGPPLHINSFQDEWFFVIEGEYLFQVGEDKYH